jgi:hypothetical protein
VIRVSAIGQIVRLLYGMLAASRCGGRLGAPAGSGEALLIIDLHPAMIGHFAATFRHRAERRPDLYAHPFGKT